MKKKYKNALQKTSHTFKNIWPILLGVILLVAFFITAVPMSIYRRIFTGQTGIDAVLGALFGSVAAGNPVNSYIIGHELQLCGVSLIAITAFIISWVTVGAVQLPAEMLLLGKKFAIWRNVLSFFSAIIISLITVLILNWL